MENQQSERYEKHRYEINVEDCTNSIIEKIEIEITDNEKKTETINRFLLAKEEYWNSIDSSNANSNVQIRKKYIVDTTHNSFYTWLAYFLTLQNPEYIPLILESYKIQKFGSVNNFCNSVEFFVLKIMFHVPFNHNEQKEAVLNWILKTNYPKNINANYDEFFVNELYPNVKIHEDWQSFLNATFIPYLDNTDDRQMLIRVMEGRYLKKGKELFVNIRANVFCDVFRTIHNRGHLIYSTKSIIAKWICNNFHFNIKGKRRALSEDYCTRLLSGHHSPNDKDSIKIDFDNIWAMNKE
jgi:hypothetical protein